MREALALLGNVLATIGFVGFTICAILYLANAVASRTGHNDWRWFTITFSDDPKYAAQRPYVRKANRWALFMLFAFVLFGAGMLLSTLAP